MRDNSGFQNDEKNKAALLEALQERQKACRSLLEGKRDKGADLVSFSQEVLDHTKDFFFENGDPKEALNHYHFDLHGVKEMISKDPSLLKEIKTKEPIIRTAWQKAERKLKKGMHENPEEGIDGLSKQESISSQEKGIPQGSFKEAKPEEKRKSRLQEWLDFIKSLPAPRDEGEALAQLLVLIFIQLGFFHREHHEKAKESFLRVSRNAMGEDQLQENQKEAFATVHPGLTDPWVTIQGEIPFHQQEEEERRELPPRGAEPILKVRNKVEKYTPQYKENTHSKEATKPEVEKKEGKEIQSVEKVHQEKTIKKNSPKS